MESFPNCHDHPHHPNQPHPHHPIAVPLLRFLINFYSAIGIPLHDYSQLDLRTLASIVKNIIIIAFLFVYIFGYDIYQMEDVINYMSQFKPLFSIVFKFTFQILTRISMICNIAYYFVFGYQIVRAVDCEPLRAAFPTGAHLRRTKRIANIFLISSIAIYIVTHNSHIAMTIFYHSPSFISIGKLPVMFVSSMQIFFVICVAFYQQYATGHALSRIECELETRRKECRISATNFSKTEFRFYLERLRAIVSVNVRINRLLTIPLTVYIVMHVSQIVNMTCIVILFFANFGWLILTFSLFPALSMSRLLTIVTLNDKNCHTLSRICKCLLRIGEQRSDASDRMERSTRLQIANGNRTKIAIKTKTKTVIVTVNRSNKKCSKSDELSISDMITIREMSLYVEQLRIRLFHLILVDRHFLLQSFLAAVGFVVFIIQTN